MNDVYQEVVKVSKNLMLREPFYGLFLISLNKELNDNIPTACVSKEGINLKLSVSPTFWSSLDFPTKTGVLKHELLHIALFHMSIWDNYSNKKLLNIACDLEVNQYIDNEYKGEKWEGLEYNQGHFQSLNLEPKMGVKYYYEKLQNEQQQNPESDLSKFMEGLGNDESHSTWGDFNDLSEAEKKLIQKQIDHNLKEIASTIKKSSGNGKGNIPNELKDYIDNLFEVIPPVIDWKSYLRRFSGMAHKILTKKTRYKQNRRFSGNPALKIKPKKRTLVAIDTSASVGENDLIEFFNEIYHIYKTGIEVTIIECDTQIQRVYDYKGKMQKIEVWGRGGTEFEPVIKYFNENRDNFGNLIYLTDGECSAPRTSPLKPILWVHCSNCRINEDLPGAKIQIKNN